MDSAEDIRNKIGRGKMTAVSNSMLGSSWDKHRQAIRLSALAFAFLFGSVALYGLGVLVGQNLGYYDAQSDGYAAQYPSDTDRRVTECFAQVGGVETQKCVEDAVTAGRDAQRSEQDLGAQRQMAKWALWLLIFTAAQSILGIFGFIALIITIRQGREANQIARRSSQAQIKAYLAVQRIKVSQPEWREGDEGELKSDAILELVNNGETPAKITEMFVEFHWRVGRWLYPMLRFSAVHSFVVHKGVPISCPLEIDAGRDGLEEIGQLFAVGRIDYLDVFEEPHDEKFCFQVDQKCRFYDLDFEVSMPRFSVDAFFEILDHTEIAENEGNLEER